MKTTTITIFNKCFFLYRAKNWDTNRHIEKHGYNPFLKKDVYYIYL